MGGTSSSSAGPTTTGRGGRLLKDVASGEVERCDGTRDEMEAVADGAAEDDASEGREEEKSDDTENTLRRAG